MSNVVEQEISILNNIKSFFTFPVQEHHFLRMHEAIGTNCIYVFVFIVTFKFPSMKTEGEGGIFHLKHFDGPHVPGTKIS